MDRDVQIEKIITKVIRVSKQHVKYLRNVETGERIVRPYYLDFITAKNALIADYYSSYDFFDTVGGYGTSAYNSAEAYYKGGVREDLYSRFIRYEMGKKFEISVNEWFNEPYPVAMHKLEIAKQIWEIETEKKMELLKKNEKDLKDT